MAERRTAKRARTCASPGCHNIFAIISRRIYCTDECGYETFKHMQRRRKARIKACSHPDCSNFYRPTSAQRYCSDWCRIDNRRCSDCRVRLLPDVASNQCRICNRVKKYGITAVEYNRLLAEQERCCRICGAEHHDGVRDGMDSPLVVDHCHDTGAVRGLLCPKCNMAIGLLGDDPQTTQAAADYLRSHKKAERW